MIQSYALDRTYRTGSDMQLNIQIKLHMAEKDDYLVYMVGHLKLAKSSEIELARRVAQAKKKGVIDTLLEVNAMTLADVAQAKAAYFGCQITDLGRMLIPDQIIKCVPSQLARKFRIIPVERVANVLTIAFEDPSDLDTIDSLNHRLRMEIVHTVANASDIDAALEKYYSKDMQELADAKK